MGDDGGHGRVGGSGRVGRALWGSGGQRRRGLLAVHCPLEAAQAQPKRCLKSQLRHFRRSLNPRPPRWLRHSFAGTESRRRTTAGHPANARLVRPLPLTSKHIRTYPARLTPSLLFLQPPCEHPPVQSVGESVDYLHVPPPIQPIFPARARDPIPFSCSTNESFARLCGLPSVSQTRPPKGLVLAVVHTQNLVAPVCSPAGPSHIRLDPFNVPACRTAPAIGPRAARPSAVCSLRRRVSGHALAPALDRLPLSAAASGQRRRAHVHVRAQFSLSTEPIPAHPCVHLSANGPSRTHTHARRFPALTAAHRVCAVQSAPCPRRSLSR